MEEVCVPWFAHLRVSSLCSPTVLGHWPRHECSLTRFANVMIERVIFIKPIRAIWLVCANRLG